MAVVFSLQDEADLTKQKIDTAAVAADCQAQGVKHVRFPTSDAGEAGACWGAWVQLVWLLPAAAQPAIASCFCWLIVHYSCLLARQPDHVSIADLF